MSIIKTRLVEIFDIVEDSNLIITVEYVEPFSEEVTVKSNDPNTTPLPFKKTGYVFKIKDVLKNTEKTDLPQTIRVPNENWRRSLSQHKEKYGGVSKSYEVKEYETEVKSMNKAHILFLHHFQGSFELNVKGAFESEDALEKVMVLVGS